MPLLEVGAEASQKLQRHSTENRYAGDRISPISFGRNQRFRPKHLQETVFLNQVVKAPRLGAVPFFCFFAIKKARETG